MSLFSSSDHSSSMIFFPRNLGTRIDECHLRVRRLSTCYPDSVSPNDNSRLRRRRRRGGERDRWKGSGSVGRGQVDSLTKRRKDRSPKAKRPLTPPRYPLWRREEGPMSVQKLPPVNWRFSTGRYHMQNWLTFVKAKLDKRFYPSEVGRVRDPQVRDWTFNPEIQ